MITEIVLLVLEIIGTISFAVSGAFVAIKARFDIFGVLVIGCVTAVGGGITRDILIGATPPAIFSKLYILAIAGFTALVVFIIAYYNGKSSTKHGKKSSISIIFSTQSVWLYLPRRVRSWLLFTAWQSIPFYPLPSVF